MTWLWSIVFGIIGLGLGAGLNPIITHLATDPKAANPLGTPRHPLLGAPTWVGIVVMVMMAAMSVILYLRLGLNWRIAYWMFISAVLIVVAAMDWKVRLIDVLVLLGATLVALVAAAFVGVGFKAALLGSVVAGIVFIGFFILAILMFPGNGVPFGLGDVYLAVFIGAVVGLSSLGVALFYGMLMAGAAAIAMLAARQMGKSDELYLSYGTYLCLGVLLFLAMFVHEYP